MNNLSMELMLQMVSTRLGTSPDKLRAALEKGDLGEITSGMSEEEKDRFEKSLNKERFQEMLNSPQFQELAKKLGSQES